MSFCPSCGSPVDGSGSFCPSCGRYIGVGAKSGAAVTAHSPAPDMRGRDYVTSDSPHPTENDIPRSAGGLIAFSIVNIVFGFIVCCTLIGIPALAGGIWGLCAAVSSGRKSGSAAEKLRKTSLIVNIVASVFAVGAVVFAVIADMMGLFSQF